MLLRRLVLVVALALAFFALGDEPAVWADDNCGPNNDQPCPEDNENNCGPNKDQPCPKDDDPDPETPDGPQVPEGDRDNDGIDDVDDLCPNQAGNANQDGCPENEDQASGAEVLELNLDDNDDIENTGQFDCELLENGEEICRSVIRFIIEAGVLALVAEDQCNQDNSQCQRKSEWFLCNEFGLECVRVRITQVTETCDANSCQRQTIQDDFECDPLMPTTCFGLIPDEAVDFTEDIRSHRIVIPVRRGCDVVGEDELYPGSTLCYDAIFECENGECTRVGSLFIYCNIEGFDGCDSYTYRLTCTPDGRCRAFAKVRNMTGCSDDGTCREIVERCECDPRIEDECVLIVVETENRLTFPGGATRTNSERFDPETGRYVNTVTDESTSADGTRWHTVAEYDCDGHYVAAAPADSCNMTLWAETRTHLDGSSLEMEAECDPTADAPSCEILETSFDADGNATSTQRWVCQPNDADDLPPYLSGTCTSVASDS